MSGHRGRGARFPLEYWLASSYSTDPESDVQICPVKRQSSLTNLQTVYIVVSQLDFIKRANQESFKCWRLEVHIFCFIPFAKFWTCVKFFMLFPFVRMKIIIERQIKSKHYKVPLCKIQVSPAKQY